MRIFNLERLKTSKLCTPKDLTERPICHIANIELAELRTPCPKGGKALLEFGWDRLSESTKAM
jgi:hypothetical protein